MMSIHPHFLWTDLFKKNKQSQKTVANNLKENILFCTLSQSELKYLSAIVYERIYQVNEPIFQQNDRGLGMYLITKGQIAIKTKTRRGEVLVTVLTEDSFFGEIALVDPGNLRTASAVAIERSVVIGFFKPDLIEILERKPAMGVKILFQLSTVLGRRLQETTEKITQMNRAKNHPSESKKAPLKADS